MKRLFFCYSAASKWWGIFCGDCLEKVAEGALLALGEEREDNLWIHAYEDEPVNASCERCNWIRSGETAETLQERLDNALYH